MSGKEIVAHPRRGMPVLRREKRIATFIVGIVILVLVVLVVVRMSGDPDSSSERDALTHSGDNQGAPLHDAKDARAGAVDLAPTFTLKLEGVVLDDSNGAPIADAAIRAHANETPLGDARTDAEGRFALSFVDVKEPTISLTAAAPAYESRTQSIDFATDQSFITIRLKPLIEKPRVGRVLDSVHKPVGGAAVKIVTAKASGGDRFDEVERKKTATLLDTITGPDGAFILPEGSEGAFACAFEASHGVGQKKVPREGPLEIILSGGESVELRVVDASTRAAIPSFEVALWSIPPAYNVPVVENMIAGRDGLCTFTDDPALYAMRVDANGYGSAELSRSRGERWPREVALTPGRRLTLRFDAPAAITGQREVPFILSADDKVTIIRGTAELGVPHVIEGFPQVKALHVLPSHPELIDPLGPEILGNSI